MSETQTNKVMFLIGRYEWLGSVVTLLVCEDESYFEVRHDGSRIDVESVVKFDEKFKAVDLFNNYVDRIMRGTTNSDEWNYIQHHAERYVEKS